jgi:hypothetical protein
LPPLPERDGRLYAIHYSGELGQNSPAETPPVSAIVVQQLLTDEQHTFAAFRIAEQRGIAAFEFLTRFPELEKQMLRDFYEFVAAHPQVVWLNWNMRSLRFGFEVLAQRAHRHGVKPVEIPLERRFNVAGYLKGLFGDQYAPNPRLWHAIHQNGVNGLGLLNDFQAAAAWQKGEYAAILQSLSCKVEAIARLFDRVRLGTFQTCPTGPDTSPPSPFAIATPPAAEQVPPAHSDGADTVTATPGEVSIRKEQPPPARHSKDYRSVHWFGVDYYFTATQAACVKVLWEAWANETPDLGQATILEHPEVEADSKRLVDLFKEHPAWGEMIVKGHTGGTYRLAERSEGS